MNKPTHIYQIKPVKPNLSSQIYKTKPSKLSLPNHTYETNSTKPNLQNQTYQTKPTKPNHTYKTKISKRRKSKRQNLYSWAKLANTNVNQSQISLSLPRAWHSSAPACQTLLTITKPNTNSYKDKNHNNNINNINYYKKTPSVKFFCYLVVISLVSHSNYYQICPPLFTANNFNARLRVHEFI